MQTSGRAVNVDELLAPFGQGTVLDSDDIALYSPEGEVFTVRQFKDACRRYSAKKARV